MEIQLTKSGYEIEEAVKDNTDPMKKICNCCIYNKLRAIHEFDDKWGHERTKMHQDYEFYKENCSYGFF